MPVSGKTRTGCGASAGKTGLPVALSRNAKASSGVMSVSEPSVGFESGTVMVCPRLGSGFWAAAR